MLSVYADGSSNGRSGSPGGFGWALVVTREHKIVDQGFGFNCDTTNNRMEMMAAIVGLRTAFFQYPDLSSEGIELVSDSQYTLGIASGQYIASKNLDLAGVLRRIFIQNPRTKTRWVKGHNGELWNVLVDGLANEGKQLANAILEGRLST